MAAMSRLGKQIEELVSTLNSTGTPFALIGGLALAPYKVIRATQDVDLLADASMAESIHRALLALGYRCLHRGPDAGNYQREDERVDLIYAHRPLALRLLASARERQTPFGQLNVVSAEGLIGSGLLSALRQGTTAARADRVNAPSRTQPLVDDAGLPASPGQTSQNPFADLDDLMCVVEALCPKWPERPTFEGSRVFLI
jgi:hypothetical protein